MANDVSSDSGAFIASRYRRFLAGLLISVVAVNVGTRSFHLRIAHSRTVESGSARAMRQHLDQDAQSWVAPVPPVAILRVHPSNIPAARPDGFPNVLPQRLPFDRPPPYC